MSNQRDYKKRPGRPRSRWNTVRTDKCDIRLTDDESYMLNRLANQYGETRSTILRKALYDFYIFTICNDYKIACEFYFVYSV